jgi:hypothetical protein
MNRSVVMNLVQRGVDELARNLSHALTLADRKAIWLAFGPYHESPISSSKPGHVRRLALATACVRRVLPVWDAMLPDKRFPHEMLDLVGRIQCGEVVAHTVLKQLHRRGTVIENWSSEYLTDPGVDLAWADWKLAFLALRDEHLLSELCSLERDEVGDSYDHDVSFFAASAESGEPYDGDGAIVARRRTFWTWYLKEAVPAAFHVVVG